MMGGIAAWSARTHSGGQLKIGGLGRSIKYALKDCKAAKYYIGSLAASGVKYTVAQDFIPEHKQAAGSHNVSLLKTTLLAMHSNLQSIDGKIDSLNMRINHMSTKLDKQAARIMAAEQRISNAEDDLQTISMKCLKIEKVLAVIQAKNKDIEACSCRTNLLITRVPEFTNTGKMEQNLETMLSTIFVVENLSALLIVERVHLSLITLSGPIIAKLLNYRDQDAIISMAMEKQDINHQGNQVAFYPDFTMEVQAAK
ncbi:hypothetical protein NDU88_001169 [Pleurodeles waltl]|uniref:Uncharacterized protein n=1 Tax=Pleurodeles waltl TaxID=8319 RepID=A0AAV7WL54_PLEWA|nr:hypothetical protein NDU88_001169 [Pleurodeles waltl]